MTRTTNDRCRYLIGLGILSLAFLLGWPAQSAEAQKRVASKTTKVTKTQQKQIARFKTKILKSALHPHAKTKMLKAIDSSVTRLGKSNYAHTRIHADVKHGQGTLVFNMAKGRSTTLYFNGKRAENVQMFQYYPQSRATFRARALDSKLTLEYRGRMKSGIGATSETNSYSLRSSTNTRNTVLTPKLWSTLNHNPSVRAQLLPKVQAKLGGSTKGLTLHGKNIRVANSAPRTLHE